MAGSARRTWHKAGVIQPPREHWALPHLLESFYILPISKTHFQVKSLNVNSDSSVLPVPLDPLETGTHPINPHLSLSQIIMLLSGCKPTPPPPLLRELVFLLISPSHLAPFLFPSLASRPRSITPHSITPRSITPRGFKACSPRDLGRTYWDGGPRCNSLFTKGAVGTEEEVWMMAGGGNGGCTALKLLKQEHKARTIPRNLLS